MNRKLLCIISGSAILCGVIAYKIYNIKFNKPRPSKPSRNYVLLHGANDTERLRSGAEDFTTVYHVLAEAVRSVDVCTPTLNSISLTNCLISLHQRGNVRIRIAVYSCTEDYTQIESLEACGIELKVIITVDKLKHELVLIDACEDFKDALLIMGPIDYDINEVNLDRSVTLITSEVEFAKKLKIEFDRIWYDYDGTRIGIMNQVSAF